MTKQKRLIVKSLGLAIFIFILLSGCNNGTSPTPSLTVDPATASVTVGGSTVNFSAELKNASDTINWTLTGAGSIAPASGETTVYTPPATGGASTATLTATAGNLSNTATITINAVSGNPDFSLRLDDNAVTIGQEGSSSIEVTVNPTGGFTDAVTFSVSGQPTGVSAEFSNGSSTTGSSLTLSVAETTAVGSSTLTITGTSGSLTKTATLNLTVAAGLPVINTVSLPTIFLGTGSNSTQLPQGFSIFSGPIQVLLSGKRLAGMTGATLGTLTGTVDSSEAGVAIVSFTIPAGFAVGQKELIVQASAGTGTKANAIEITPWTVAPAAIGGVEVGTPNHPFTALSQTKDRATSGDTITIANGTYNTASGETFPVTIAAGVTVIGENKAGTILTGETTKDCLVLAGSASVSRLSISTCVRSFVATTGTITLEDINGSNFGAISTSIAVSGSAEITVKNSAFTKNNIGIEVTGNAKASLLASSFNSNFAGLFASDEAVVSATNSSFDNNTGSGIFVEQRASVTLDGGTVSNNGTTSNTDENIGLFIKDSAEATVVRTTFDSNGLGDGTAGSESDGIRIIGNGTLTVTDITISNSGLDGLGACCGTVADKPVVNITGSTITGSGEDGLNFFDDTVATVFNTTIAESGGNGINVEGNATEGPKLTLATVTSNKNGANGIVLSDAESFTASGLTANENSFTGLNVGTMGDLAVLSSIFNDNGTNGITLGIPEDVELRGVAVTNNGQDGVGVSSAKSLIVQGSSLSDNGGNGIVFGSFATTVEVDLGTAAQAGGNIFEGNGVFGLNDGRSTSAITINAVGNTFGGADAQPSGLKTGPASETNRWNIVTAGNKIQY